MGDAADNINAWEKLQSDLNKLKELEKLLEEYQTQMRKQFCNICYKCEHRRDLHGDCHSSCNNLSASVFGAEHGIKMGWFNWPFNFDPVWLEYCTGFEEKDVSPDSKSK